MPAESDDERFLVQMAAHDPLQAVAWGVPIDDLPSLEPDWWQERQRLWAAQRDSQDPVLRAAAFAEERWMAQGEHLRAVHATIDSPVFAVRQCLDEVPLGEPDDVERYARLLESVPRALAGLEKTLEQGVARGRTAAVRQVSATIDALAEWSAAALVERVDAGDFEVAPGVRSDVVRAAADAAQAFARFGTYLRDRYAPQARAGDAFGVDGYRIWASRYFAEDPDLGWYGWARDELDRVLVELDLARRAAERAGPSTIVEGAAAHRRWATGFVGAAGAATSAVVPLPGTDPGPAVKLMPQGGIGTYSAYYSPPHGVEPGAVWIDGGDGPHYVEYEKVLLAHEGLPGHHAETLHQRGSDRLSPFQRVAYLPAHSEGWGLYAEQIADEVGLFDTPHSRAGYLGSLALRVASVVVDMGVHCSLHEDGESWSIARASELLASVGLGEAAARSWMTNILGRPGHRSTYAIGKQAWIEARATARARGCTDAAFHVGALTSGPCDLVTLRTRDGASMDQEPRERS